MKIQRNYKKILILGSGALKISEAGEFDYSGSQAIKALKEEGKKIILINPNIATNQTSEGLADEIYFLPVQPEFVEQVIKKEKPDGILLSFGGQTALNCGMQLYKKGILKKYNVDILGTPIQAVIDTEDREKFAQRMDAIGLKTAKGKIVYSLAEGLAYGEELGLPVMLRTGFALGGAGSGIAKDKAALKNLLQKAFATSTQVIVEESLKGWKEIEYEVVRDSGDNCITVCNMENFDPVGIHTGESIVVAPSQTLNNNEYFQLRQIAMDAIREFKIVGECNIQYAVNPDTFDYRIIEVNARLSRSSALASKATGYPLAYIAAKLALGKTLPELKNLVTKKTSAFFEPALDYVVVKIPRWDLDKYTNVVTDIGSEMKSVGEIMSIARTFEEALQKGVRMLNQGHNGVLSDEMMSYSKQTLLQLLDSVDTNRLFTVCAALTKGVTVEQIHKKTKIDLWFLHKLNTIVQVYKQLQTKKSLHKDLLTTAKKVGFSDRQIAQIFEKPEKFIRNKRKKMGITPVIKQIDTLAGEFPAQTNYLYMTYNGSHHDHIPNNKEDKVIVIGGGPYSIGTSVEFDWCAVNTVSTLRKNGVKGIMINCNPETVSTDYDHSDYLYFEELSLERVLDIYDLEQAPCIVSVGGQIPNNLALPLHEHGVKILGTQATDVYRAEYRKTFSKILDTLDIPQPFWIEAKTYKQALRFTQKIGFPVLVRPSFVLSGKAMSVLESETDLERYMSRTDINFEDHPLVITRFLRNATECDFDGVAKNGTMLSWALSEHVEGGGVHSGDSTLLFPSVTISDEMKNRIIMYAEKILKELRVNGPFNIQFLLSHDVPYVIECNLRASRSLPFVSKALNYNFIAEATKVAIGKPAQKLPTLKIPYQVVKVPQFSFHKLRGADPVLRVEMSSTGEVAAFGSNVEEAYLKAILATGVKYPKKKAVFVSLGGSRHKLSFLRSCVRLKRDGFTIYSTAGTAFFLNENDIPTIVAGKLGEKIQPTISDLIQKNEIDFAVIVSGKSKEQPEKNSDKAFSDGYTIRRMAVDFGIPVFTNTQTAAYYVDAVHKYKPSDLPIKSWREYIERLTIND